MASVVVDSGRPFLNETREIASLYVDLCYSYSDEASTEIGLDRSPAPGRRMGLDSAGGPPPPGPVPTTAAFAVSCASM